MSTRITDKLRTMLGEKEFYEMMQAYRHAPVAPQQVVVEKFNAIKSYLVGFVSYAEKHPE